jgi:hypothetical protein
MCRPTIELADEMDLRKKRQRNGSILVLIVSFVAILLIIGYFVVAWCGLVLTVERSRSKAELLSLSMACKLNANDHGGKLNGLAQKSRTLVSTDRLLCDEIYGRRITNLESIANQLLEESRSGAKLLEETRQKQVGNKLDEIRAFALAAAKERDPTLTYRIRSIEVGTIRELHSSAKDEAPEAVQDFDLRSGYVNNRSGLLRGHTDARLPGNDSDLSFKFSPLPAPNDSSGFQTNLAPEHLFVPTAVIWRDGKPVPSKCEYLPPAVRLEIVSGSTLPSPSALKGPVVTSCVARTNGASPSD